MDHALEMAGWKCLWRCENDRHARRVLFHHRPDIEVHDDVRTLDASKLAPVSLVAGGIPCQGWSLAGKRTGLAHAQSGIFLEFVRLVDSVAPRWVLFENVFGLLSHGKGEDFARVLGELSGAWPEVPRKGWRRAGFGYGPKRSLAWRVLDSRSVGGCPLHVCERGHGPVPQRRRRVFIVAHTGDVAGLAGQAPGQDSGGLLGLPVSVLFDPESWTRHFEEGPEEEQGVAAAPEGGLGSASGQGAGGRLSQAVVYGLAQSGPREQAAACNAHGQRLDFDSENFVAEPTSYNIIGLGQEGKNHAYESDATGALQHKGNSATGNEAGTLVVEDVTTAVAPGDRRASGQRSAEKPVVHDTIIRRLTPTECLRLQGMSDDYLDLEPPLPQGAKYKLIGNGTTRQVVEWVGSRLALAHDGGDPNG
jgi:DNA (cytosine-5)-methyltransferase 1